MGPGNLFNLCVLKCAQRSFDTGHHSKADIRLARIMKPKRADLDVARDDSGFLVVAGGIACSRDSVSTAPGLPERPHVNSPVDALLQVGGIVLCLPNRPVALGTQGSMANVNLGTVRAVSQHAAEAL